MFEFISQHSSAVFTLVGVMLGGLISGIFSVFGRTKETKLRLTEKLLDKKLEAHESILWIVGTIRTNVLLGGVDENDQLSRCPLVMLSRENMDEFLREYSRIKTSSELWIGSKVKREMSLFLDYFATINEQSKNTSDENLMKVGAMLRTDYINFSMSIENAIRDFFDTDLLNLDYKMDRGWHKFSSDESHSKLSKTEYLRNEEMILHIFHSSQ